jgi:hypothetical protein
MHGETVKKKLLTVRIINAVTNPNSSSSSSNICSIIAVAVYDAIQQEYSSLL